MAVYRCKRCKSIIEFEAGATETVCKMCGKKQRLPRLTPEQAAALRKRIAVIAAIFAAVCAVFAVLLITVIIPFARYNAAVGLYGAGKYDEAIKAFTALNGYKDSDGQIEKCKEAKKEASYNSAVQLYENGKFEEALSIFTSLNGYKDSADRAVLCGAAFSEQRYNEALSLIERGDIMKAYETLIKLDGYKDSADKAKDLFDQYKSVKLRAAAAGDTVYFGKYEQDNDPSNGKEDIEWLVLDKNGDDLLILSRYALDSHPYNSVCSDITWETCTLRTWLNDTFFNAAFDEEEQKSVIVSTVTADKNPWYDTPPGNDTEDKIFLLSIDEANRYLTTGESRMCAPTEYAMARGAGTGESIFEFGRHYCWWVLRSPGYYPYYVSFVYYSGYVNLYGYESSLPSDAVRPALRIRTK